MAKASNNARKRKDQQTMKCRILLWIKDEKDPPEEVGKFLEKTLSLELMFQGMEMDLKGLECPAEVISVCFCEEHNRYDVIVARTLPNQHVTEIPMSSERIKILKSNGFVPEIPT